MDWIDRATRRVKLRDLHMLMAVAEAGSMSKASERLAVSHPVVSKTISDLERTLGVRLFDRASHGVEPTAYGQALLQCGAAVFDAMRQGIKQIEYLDDPTTGELRIGCPDIITAGLLPTIIERFSRDYPKVRFHVIHVANTAVMQVHELRNRNVEILFARTPKGIADNDLVVETLFDEPFVLVAGAQSKWARRRRLDLRDLVEERWVLPPYDSVPGRLILEIFRSAKLQPPMQSMATLSVQLTTNLIATGAYIGILPRSVAQYTQRVGLKILPARLSNQRLALGIITLKNRSLGPLASLFLDRTRKVVAPFQHM
jgi:DNA-binding transcriptional LysR family regulator